MADTWQTHGMHEAHMAYTCHTHDRHMADTWQTHGRNMADS